MKGFLAVFKREYRSYFATPIALIFLVVFLILNGFFTFKLGRFFEMGQADLRAFFLWHPWLYLFIVPAVSMRLWAEEKHSGTIELLLTLPVTLTQVFLAKFLAAWAFLILALVLTCPIVVTVAYLGEPDFGVIVSGYIGSALMAGTFLAVGTAISALTRNQIISFVVATSICLILILIGFEPVVQMLLGFFPVKVVDQITNLGFPTHFESIQRGVIDMRDIIYFVSIMVFSCFAGALALNKERAE